jgi:hypothetical protein
MASNYENPLPGVPTVESPFFDELFDRADPDYEIALSLREHGFAIIDFPDDQIGEISERIKSNLKAHYPWEKWQTGNADMRVMDAWAFDKNVRRVATNRRIVELLSKLYGRRAFPFQTLNFPVGTQQHFHSDSAHFSSRPERYMCGVWLALEDVGPEQGPLIYYPGSHRLPVYTRENIGKTFSVETGFLQSAFEPMWDRLVDKLDMKPSRFNPKKGQALIWAANLLHGGDQHHDRSLTRWSQVTHYYFENCVYYSPLSSNEPAGEWDFKRPVDIVSMDTVAPSYHGRPISEAVLSDGQARRHLPPDGWKPEKYLKRNPDVRASGMDPWDHYMSFGKAEGRDWRG